MLRAQTSLFFIANVELIQIKLWEQRVYCALMSMELTMTWQECWRLRWQKFVVLPVTRMKIASSSDSTKLSHMKWDDFYGFRNFLLKMFTLLKWYEFINLFVLCPRYESRFASSPKSTVQDFRLIRHVEKFIEKTLQPKVICWASFSSGFPQSFVIIQSFLLIFKLKKVSLFKDFQLNVFLNTEEKLRFKTSRREGEKAVHDPR